MNAMGGVEGQAVGPEYFFPRLAPEQTEEDHEAILDAWVASLNAAAAEIE